MRRMDRYKEENPIQFSRSEKNQELYQNIGKNTRYANFVDVTNTNAYDISSVDRNNKTRENYQKMLEYSNFLPGPKVKSELEKFKSAYKEKENRVYDINSVIAEARKNRVDQDDKESKRKLKNDKYNILLNMTKEELEEYRKDRKAKYTHPDEDKLHDLIDTITSKTLAGEIDKNTSVNLLSELMATSIMDKVGKPDDEDTHDDLKITSPVKMSYDDTNDNIKVEAEITIEEDSKLSDKIESSFDEKEADDNNQEDISSEKIDSEQLRLLNDELDQKQETKKDNVDTEFYTKSMDLSDKDFEDEMDDEFKEKKLPLSVKILIFILVSIVVAFAVYYIYMMI